MTLNITVLARDVIYQSSDFRLWDPKANELITDSSNKSISVNMGSWDGAITYTGIGGWEDKDTSESVIEWLAGRDNLTFNETIDLIEDNGNRWIAGIARATGRRWRHTFVITAFVDQIATATVLSNFQELNASRRTSIDHRLRRSTTRYTSDPVVLITGCLNSPLSRQQRRHIQRVVRDHGSESERIRVALQEANRRAATSGSSCPISEECIVQSFDRRGLTFSSGAPTGVEQRQIMGGVDVGALVEQFASEFFPGGYTFVGATGVAGGRGEVEHETCVPKMSTRASLNTHELIELAPGANRNSTAASLNVAMECVGSSNDKAFTPGRACRWTENESIFLPNLGGLTSNAQDINSSGLIVGSAEDPDRYLRGCIWDTDNRLAVLAADGAFQSAATCVSDTGFIGGWVSFDSRDRGQLQNRPAVWAPDGSVRVLSTLPADWGQVDAISGNGTALITCYQENRPTVLAWRQSGQIGTFPFHDAWLTTLSIDEEELGYTVLRRHNGQMTVLQWRTGEDWKEHSPPSGWNVTAASPAGVLAGNVKLDGWYRPWLWNPPAPPIILPHYVSHNSHVSRVLDSMDAAGNAATDHGSHALVWRNLDAGSAG
jgi:uncharacterized membrane protein